MPTSHGQAEEVTADVDSLISWLLENDENLDNIPFARVVEATSGHQVLPVIKNDAIDSQMLQLVSSALKACLAQVEVPEHPIHQVGRVNEISRYIEDILFVELNRSEGYTCTIPVNASGDLQRSGYPDLRFEHVESGRVFYIDPKIYKSESERSSFRTFYFEPKDETNKILDDASHLILGIAHAGKVDELWQLSSWQIIDLVAFKVQLKAEFQASNRDLYHEDAVLGKSNN
jgi:hypothetical protein